MKTNLQYLWFNNVWTMFHRQLYVLYIFNQHVEKVKKFKFTGWSVMMYQTIEMICIKIYHFNRMIFLFSLISQSNCTLCQHVTETTHNQNTDIFFTIEVKDKKTTTTTIFSLCVLKMLKQYKSVQIRCHKHFISPYLQNNGELWKNVTFNSRVFLSMPFNHDSVT